MKKISPFLVKIMAINLFLAVCIMGNAQSPAYENRLLNDSLLDANTYEFDIYLLRTGSTTFELAAYQMGLYFNPDIVNGGTVTASIVSGSSTLSNPAQWPTAVSIGNGSSGQFCRAGLAYYIIRLQSKSPPGAGNGSIISNTYPGSRVCRIRLVNSVAFGQASPIQCFNFASSPFNTIVRAYVGGTSTDITNQSWHFISDLTNPTLNLPVPVHTMTGGGITPVNVGLDGSDVGIRYWLYRDGVSTQWPTNGTGSAFNFNGSPFSLPGTYTSVGWRKATYLTANMTGSAFACTLPTAYNVIGGGNYCTGGTGMMVGLADSDIGVIYQLKKDGSLYGSTQPGTGSQIEWANNPPGSYTVVANPGGGMCENAMTGTVTITEIALPTVYNVGGSGDYCSFGPVQVTLSGSQTTVAYQLYKNSVAEGTPVTGTGNPLSWPVTASGNYTVKASYLVPLPCETNMNGTAVIVYNTEKVLNLKFFLEGLYAGGSQMFPVSDGTNYVFGSNVADTFHIELISYVNYPPVYKSFNSQLAIDGTVQIPIPCLLSGSYYIVIKHRNSVETWSKEPVSFSGTTINYNFSIAASQALGDNQQNLGGGVYGVYGGDENQDGAVDANDIGDIDNDASNFTMGYVVTDVNGDGIVDTNDMGLTDNNSSSFVIYVTPPPYGTPCPGLPQITDTRDGRVYHTVQIGTQCWLRENLNIGNRIDVNVSQMDDNTIEKYCYNNDEENCDEYGGLYQWGEIVQYLNGASNTSSWNPIPTASIQGLCPLGWHVPSQDEWMQLINLYGGLSLAGGKTKETGFLHWSSPNTSATNESGFTALPSGHSWPNNTFGYLSEVGYFWTATEHLPDSPSIYSWYYFPGYNYAGIGQAGYYKTYGFSLRCIKGDALPTLTTSSITNITPTSATSGGNVISDGGAPITARGVCWSTSQNSTIANDHTTDGTGTGSFTSNIVGLVPNTLYYVRAYATNSVGTAYGNEVSCTTLWACGVSLSVTHIAGEVAPVNKTTTYGTTTNIPGEPTKCWITSNLGSDHQATAVDDATEASAGWYWQFNRKQGYKHDGTTRTPNTTWISSISEISNWTEVNDPCKIELGNGWRISTSTEWTNVNAVGGWTNWNGSWNSGIKIHAAGYLWGTNGALYDRGSTGNYWSSTQFNTIFGWNFDIGSGNSDVSGNNKADGYPLRCINGNTNLPFPTVTTSSASNITPNTSTSGGEVISDGGSPVTVKGICWSTSQYPTISDNHTTDGSGTGIFTSNLTGLTPNTLYYVRAYATNSAVTAYGDQVSFTTSAWSCGYAFTVNHVAGNVAPVNKSVYYGTVTNIPGETTKCWITNNLGSDHQATAVNDNTEASAGWYWQFNRKQGYKHDGTTRTPNTTWITSINENSNWTTANDPCSSELGTGWRIPTSTEWTNVDASGSWTNYNGPWNSLLKMHAAGFLGVSDGSLSSRGSYGYYWSSAQNGNADGWELGFHSSICNMYYHNKTIGFSLRCIKDGPNPSLPNVTTTSASNITPNTATSGGNVTSDGGALVTAKGVCWNSSPNPTLANSHTSDGTGNGVFVSNITGLTANTLYYVRAYATNSVGTAYGDQVSFTTLWTCSAPLTINHVAGLVAPVSKTTTYGTVSNVPGEPTKCWITSNLGSDHQATAVNDATEASAGWYWQFNRKQGYKHDGTNRTPNTTWISSIDENSNWASENDPCTLELGTGWRIPTSTEWSNVDASGNWTNWNGPWNSLLKMHAAGELEYGSSSLNLRGGFGYYWGSTQGNNTQGWHLYFYSPDCLMLYNYKAYGFSLRCVKDCSSPPSSPSSGTHLPSQIQIIWNWNTVSGATGYKWNTINDYGTATDMGTATTKTETGLSCNTSYTRYAWAYNNCGYSTPVTLTQLTLACWICGDPFTINHVAGIVAPVTKSVTYGTVTNVPGETSKCWITKNLGASQQATAVSDATEASAGWYWQFNRKQGYKYDGTTRTPNTTWISSINENSNWTSDKDPCTLELGTGWRIPTSTEWTNVDASGSWTNWNGPWNSLLKMHAAGYLHSSNGSLYNRGSYGTYWSSAQSSTTDGWYLYFYSSDCSMVNDNKANGFSLRCVQDCSSPPSSPSSGTHLPSQIQIIWNWNTVSGATGYKWNTTNNYGTATDMGTATSKTETGLTCNILYTRYVWAYNSCGYSTPVTLTQLTLACWICGDPFTINHVAGIVAPVTKSVTYGTVTNVPGETSKCWITRNLGASQQATAVSDATEASAGWYWQFNRKQGYKHDGTTRTPNTTWISSINENSDWTSANDPCTLELGTGWRIPTLAEWTNVDASGSWTDWNGPWNSLLKMHAAGNLNGINGLLSNPGSLGSYWSSNQETNTRGWNLVFHSAFSVVNGNDKVDGYSIRCIKNLQLPIVSTTSISNISSNAATSGGNVPDAGGSPVTIRGVCWNSSPNPTTANSHTSDGTGTGVFVSNITGLTANTLYYVRAYATNSLGTAYGDEITFFSSSTGGQPCSGTPTVSYVGKTYNTVQIGTQCWLRENLNIGTMISGSNNQANNSIIEKYCYNNLESNCDVYGGLYQWAEAIQYLNGASNTLSWNPIPTGNIQGICPSGWHIPSDAEWSVLSTFLGGENIAGGKLKEPGTIHWASPNTGATNEIGFTALPAGHRDMNGGGTANLGTSGNFSSSSEAASDHVWFRDCANDNTNLSRGNLYKAQGISVRCVKN